MSYADLHMHSNASDGVRGPAEIVEVAAQTPGLEVVALTDHDTLANIAAMQCACDARGIGFVPGVEITTKHGGRAVHMLGYFPDPDGKVLEEYLHANNEKRAKRAYQMADRLGDAGFPICAEDLAASDATPNRPLLARILVKRGCAASVDDAFARLLGSKSPYYVDAVYPDSIEAIKVILEAGGHAFIAHPARYGVVDLIARFAREGMAGLEAFHTQHAPEQAAELVELASQLGLGVSGGSDWHGDDVHQACLGGAGLDEAGYDAFLRACGRA